MGGFRPPLRLAAVGSMPRAAAACRRSARDGGSVGVWLCGVRWRTIRVPGTIIEGRAREGPPDEV